MYTGIKCKLSFLSFSVHISILKVSHIQTFLLIHDSNLVVLRGGGGEGTRAQKSLTSQRKGEFDRICSELCPNFPRISPDVCPNFARICPNLSTFFPKLTRILSLAKKQNWWGHCAPPPTVPRSPTPMKTTSNMNDP